MYDLRLALVGNRRDEVHGSSHLVLGFHVDVLHITWGQLRQLRGHFFRSVCL